MNCAIGPVNSLPVGRQMHQIDYTLFFFLPGICVFVFSPILAWAYAILALTMFSEQLGPLSRKSLGLLVVVSGAAIVSSRALFLSSADDFSNYYYPTFKMLQYGGLRSAFKFGGGFEPGLSIILIGLHFLCPTLVAPAVLFVLVMIPSVLFWYWLETYGIVTTEPRYKAAVVGMSLVFYSNFFASQLVRQFLSSVLLLFAISQKEKIRQFIFLLLASLCHLSALPVFGIWYAAKRWKLSSVLIFSGLFLAGVSHLGSVVGYAHALGLSHVTKLYFYASAAKNAKWSEMNAVKEPLLVLLGISFFFLLSSHSKEERGKEWRNFAFVMTAAYIILIPLPLASLRFTLMVFGVAGGYFLFEATPRRLKRLWFLCLVAFTFLAWRLYRDILPDPANDMRFWVQYPWFGWLF